MRNPFRRRRRVTTPPEVVPLLVIAVVAVFVAQLTIGVFGSVAAIAWTLLPGGESLPAHPAWLAAGAATLALSALLMVLGWWCVRRLVTGWFRRQPPEPLGPAA
jgi:hypothetical protein